MIWVVYYPGLWRKMYSVLIFAHLYKKNYNLHVEIWWLLRYGKYVVLKCDNDDEWVKLKYLYFDADGKVEVFILYADGKVEIFILLCQ